MIADHVENINHVVEMSRRLSSQTQDSFVSWEFGAVAGGHLKALHPSILPTFKASNRYIITKSTPGRQFNALWYKGQETSIHLIILRYSEQAKGFDFDCKFTSGNVIIVATRRLENACLRLCTFRDEISRASWILWQFKVFFSPFWCVLFCKQHKINACWGGQIHKLVLRFQLCK